MRVFASSMRGTSGGVTLWLLLTIPGTLGVLAAVLILSMWAEERFLSPRSLILGAVRSRWNAPDHVEAYVTKQLERLLEDHRP